MKSYLNNVHCIFLDHFLGHHLHTFMRKQFQEFQSNKYITKRTEYVTLVNFFWRTVRIDSSQPVNDHYKFID